MACASHCAEGQNQRLSMWATPICASPWLLMRRGNNSAHEKDVHTSSQVMRATEGTSKEHKQRRLSEARTLAFQES